MRLEAAPEQKSFREMKERDTSAGQARPAQNSRPHQGSRPNHGGGHGGGGDRKPYNPAPPVKPANPFNNPFAALLNQGNTNKK